MRLIARINGVHGLIDCLLNYTGILAPFPVTMLVDTGASCSCLLQDHVYYFEIPYRRLADGNEPIRTASGRVTPKILPNVDLILPVRTGPDHSQTGLFKIHFDEFRIIPPQRRFRPVSRQRVVSIVGMDVLRLFKNWQWKWDALELVMDE